MIAMYLRTFTIKILFFIFIKPPLYKRFGRHSTTDYSLNILYYKLTNDTINFKIKELEFYLVHFFVYLFLSLSISITILPPNRNERIEVITVITLYPLVGIITIALIIIKPNIKLIVWL